jgi:hypothetical protein
VLKFEPVIARRLRRHRPRSNLWHLDEMVVRIAGKPLNKLIGNNDTMNAQRPPNVKMPNRDGFIVRFPDAMKGRQSNTADRSARSGRCFPVPVDSGRASPSASGGPLPKNGWFVSAVGSLALCGRT